MQHIDQQHNLFLQDHEKYGDKQEGEHCGMKWKAIRVKETYWYGYFYPNRILSATEFDVIHYKLAHYGIDHIHRKENFFGFDCAHFGDFCPQLNMYNYRYQFVNEREVYRDFPYVKSKLIAILEYIDERTKEMYAVGGEKYREAKEELERL